MPFRAINFDLCDRNFKFQI